MKVFKITFRKTIRATVYEKLGQIAVEIFKGKSIFKHNGKFWGYVQIFRNKYF